MTEETQNQTPETPATTETPEKTSTRQMSFVVLDSGAIQATFGEGIEPLTLNPMETPEAIQAAAVTEGLISRARSYTSKLKDDGRTPAALRDAIAKAFENLKAGIWKIERAEGTGEISIEAEAAHEFKLSRAKSKGEEYTATLAETAAAFAALSDEQKKQLKAVTRYQVAYAEVKARRAAEKAKKLLEKAEKEEDNADF